jgi:hypothetical protein
MSRPFPRFDELLEEPPVDAEDTREGEPYLHEKQPIVSSEDRKGSPEQVREHKEYEPPTAPRHVEG